MRKKMTKAEALKQFRVFYKTDALCKEGLITLHQYENWGQPF